MELTLKGQVAAAINNGPDSTISLSQGEQGNLYIPGATPAVTFPTTLDGITGAVYDNWITDPHDGWNTDYDAYFTIEDSIFTLQCATATSAEVSSLEASCAAFQQSVAFPGVTEDELQPSHCDNEGRGYGVAFTAETELADGTIECTSPTVVVFTLPDDTNVAYYPNGDRKITPDLANDWTGTQPAGVYITEFCVGPDLYIESYGVGLDTTGTTVSTQDAFPSCQGGKLTLADFPVTTGPLA